MADGLKHPVWTNYLSNMRCALASAPRELREEILAETRCHIRGRVESGAANDDILKSMGDANTYAAQFLDACDLSREPGAKKRFHSLRLLFSFCIKSIFVGAAIGSVVLLWALTLLMLLFSALKLANPDKVGFWEGDTGYYLGVNASGVSSEDLLGWWLLAITAIMLMGAWRASRSLTVRVRRQFSG